MSINSYYEQDGITIYHGDCREVLPTLAPVDVVITSPPYNMGNHPSSNMGHSGSKWVSASVQDGYGECSDDLPLEQYEEQQRGVLRAMWDALSDSGVIFYNHKPRPRARELWTPLRLNPSLPLRQIVIWERAGGLNFSRCHYVPTHEWVMVFARPSWELKSRGASGVGDVWRIPQESNTKHPAPFPLALPLRILDTVNRGTVLDPYCGSGTTLRAAKDCGFPAIGIEINEAYCEIAAKRLSQGALNLEMGE